MWTKRELGILLLASVMAAISIVLDGAMARITNGAAGGVWFLAAALVARTAWHSSRRPALWGASLGLTFMTAFIVKPTALVPAMVGFGMAATAVAIIARRDALLWAMTIIAFYLPFHVGTAVANALYRNATGEVATLRTDPPPTAAIVPLVMYFTAFGCGIAIQAYLQRRSDGQAGSVRPRPR